MSELIIAPELAFKLQTAAREAGYTNHDLHTLADQTFLTSLLPALIGQGTVVEQRRLKPFTRVSYDEHISFELLLESVKVNGVRITDWAQVLLSESAYVSPLSEGEVYDIYHLSGTDLGLFGTKQYPRWVYETRAAALGLELGPPILALYAIACFGFQGSCCHVASEPFSRDGYTAQYFEILTPKELHTELDVFDNEVARSALLSQNKIYGSNQWLFFKKVE